MRWGATLAHRALRQGTPAKVRNPRRLKLRNVNPAHTMWRCFSHMSAPFAKEWIHEPMLIVEYTTMRRLRWKAAYATGDAGRDAAQRELVGRLNAFIDDARRVEHCQDLNDLLESLVSTSKGALSQGKDACTAVEGVLEASLPLAAKDTPACSQCGLCDVMEERLCTGETACSSC